MQRATTPPALLYRSPGNKESGFWTERCRREEGSLRASTVEHPWLEAAAQRGSLTASVTQRTLLQQPASIPATTWIHSHDKVVERCQHTHRPMAEKQEGSEGGRHASSPHYTAPSTRPVLLPPGCCASSCSSTLAPSASYLTPAERYRPLKASTTIAGSGASGSSPAHLSSRAAGPGETSAGQVAAVVPAMSAVAATQRRRNAELQQRIAAVQEQLEEERRRTECARKALHAATHRSVTCGESATWHQRER